MARRLRGRASRGLRDLRGSGADSAAVYAYDNAIVHGLLQTWDYARALLRAVRRDDTPAMIDKLVELRMARQQLLTRAAPLTLWAILDEAVLHRRVGGRQVMCAQLEHLATVGTAPNVTIQVLPYSRGAHPGMAGPFSVIELGSGDPNILYVDSPTGNIYVERPAQVRHHEDVFNHLRAEALPADESAELITATRARELPDRDSPADRGTPGP
nr:DUF5753 domain-containing protein [Streptomyces sp. SID3343]